MKNETSSAPDWGALIRRDREQRARMARNALGYACYDVNADKAGITYGEASRNPEETRHRQMLGRLGAAHGTRNSNQIPRRARLRAQVYADLKEWERFVERLLLRKEKQMYLEHRIMNEADRADYINALPDDEAIPPKPNKGAARAEHRLAAQFRPRPDDPYSAKLE